MTMIPCATALLLDLPASAQPKTTATGLVGFENGIRRFDHDAARRKIRAANFGLQRILILGLRHQLFDRSIGMLDQMQRRGAEFRNIMRRDRRRHADGNAR